MTKKKALIFGITGQDGSYLAELLLSKNYEVHGVIRRSSSFNTARIDHIFDDLILYHGDVTDALSTSNIIAIVKPDELYNLSAQSHVRVSFDQPYYTAQVDALGVMCILESVRIHCPSCKIYQASTSELFGGMQYNMPIDGYTEESEFHPRSPYAVAKLYGYWATKNYREAYNLYACNGILFNHESERRGETFITRKITMALSSIYNGKQKTLTLGNLESCRDWGHAKDYVYGMYLMLQQDVPQDYVLASGETHSVREFVEMASLVLGWTIKWSGDGINEIGIIESMSVDNEYVNVGDEIIKIDARYFRPSEVDVLLGNPYKAISELKWKQSYSFGDLIKSMMINDLELSK